MNRDYELRRQFRNTLYIWIKAKRLPVGECKGGKELDKQRRFLNFHVSFSNFM